MLSTLYKVGCQQLIRLALAPLRMHCGTYAEGLKIVDGQSISVQVEQSILEHASVAVARGLLRSEARHLDNRAKARGGEGERAHERTKRSRFSHFGFFGLNFMNLL